MLLLRPREIQICNDQAALIIINYNNSLRQESAVARSNAPNIAYTRFRTRARDRRPMRTRRACIDRTITSSGRRGTTSWRGKESKAGGGGRKEITLRNKTAMHDATRTRNALNKSFSPSARAVLADPIVPLAKLRKNPRIIE